MILARVDDFPFTKSEEAWKHNVENFKLFDVVMKKYFSSYVLGVIPRRVTDEQLLFLKNLDHIDIAVHGIDHDERFRNEFREHETEGDIYSKLLEAKNRFERITGRVVDSYIPPHNVIDMKTIRALKKAGFKRIFGGPGTDKSILGLCYVLNVESHYSAEPFEYGRSDEMLQRGAVEYWDKKVDKVIPSYITFHWTWEVNIGLENLEKFLEALKPSIEI
jgi:hypothetical protein